MNWNINKSQKKIKRMNLSRLKNLLVNNSLIFCIDHHLSSSNNISIYMILTLSQIKMKWMIYKKAKYRNFLIKKKKSQWFTMS
jgi:hypothetical protein